MKKGFLLIAVLGFLVAGLVSVSCSKDDDGGNWKGCSCKAIFMGVTEDLGKLSAEEIKEELGSKVKNCTDVQKAIKNAVLEELEEDPDLEGLDLSKLLTIKCSNL